MEFFLEVTVNRISRDINKACNFLALKISHLVNRFTAILTTVATKAVDLVRAYATLIPAAGAVSNSSIHTKKKKRKKNVKTVLPPYRLYRKNDDLNPRVIISLGASPR